MQYIDAIRTFSPSTRQEAADKDTMLEYIRHFPANILTRENAFAHLTASGFIVNSQVTKTLMVYHNIYRSWSWTGGHADGRDNLLSVALREAEEETGATGFLPLSPGIASLDILPVRGHCKHDAYISTHLHLSAAYLLELDESAPIRPCPGENTAVQWIPLEGLANFVSEADMLPVYQKLIRRAQDFRGGIR